MAAEPEPEVEAEPEPEPEPEVEPEPTPEPEPEPELEADAKDDEDDTSIGSSFVLPGIDYRPPDPVEIEEEQSANEDELDEEPYILPERARSNAAYLTSLIDTAQEEEPSRDTPQVPTEPMAAEQSPTGHDSIEQSPVDASEPKKPITIISTAKKSKPTIAFNKKQKTNPSAELTENKPEEKAKKPIKITSSKKTSKPVIRFNKEEKKSPEVENKPHEEISTKSHLATEWVGEPTPVTKDESSPIVQDELSSVSTAEPMTMAPQSLTFEPIYDPAEQSGNQTHEWVGEPTPIIKDEPAPAAPTPATMSEPKEETTLSSMAAKLEARLAQRKLKADSNPEPVQSTLPIQEPVQKPAQSPPPQQSQQTPSSPLQGLLSEIDTRLDDAKTHFKAGNTKGVAEATGHIAKHAENFGLRTLGRLARTVESAANAGDMDALHDLFPELEINIERNRIALQI